MENIFLRRRLRACFSKRRRNKVQMKGRRHIIRTHTNTNLRDLRLSPMKGGAYFSFCIVHSTMIIDSSILIFNGCSIPTMLHSTVARGEWRRPTGRPPVGRSRPRCSSTVTHGGEVADGEVEAAPDGEHHGPCCSSIVAHGGETIDREAEAAPDEEADGEHHEPREGRSRE
jgi:hypothetical protein